MQNGEATHCKWGRGPSGADESQSCSTAQELPDSLASRPAGRQRYGLWAPPWQVDNVVRCFDREGLESPSWESLMVSDSPWVLQGVVLHIP